MPQFKAQCVFPSGNGKTFSSKVSSIAPRELGTGIPRGATTDDARNVRRRPGDDGDEIGGIVAAAAAAGMRQQRDEGGEWKRLGEGARH